MSAKADGSSAINAAWVLNFVGLGVIALPGWGLVIAFLFITPIWIASFVLACVGTARGRALQGAFLIAFDLVLFPLITIAMVGVSLKGAIDALIGK